MRYIFTVHKIQAMIYQDFKKGKGENQRPDTWPSHPAALHILSVENADLLVAPWDPPTL